VIVGLHWGYEYQREADPGQERIARALLAAGADLVAGHHPHVIQGAGYDERAGGAAGFVFYSLGNFAFDQAQPGTEHGLALRAFFDRRGLRGLQGLPIAAGPRPRLAGHQTPLPAAEPLGLRRETLSFNCQGGGCVESGAGAVSSRAGIPSSVELDLTGDLRPEVVHLTEQRLIILEGGRPTWHSPPEWRVLDMAPGDPDGDGRGDLVLAVLKPGEDGRPRSHPYVLGYRGGLYRLVWGGSPVRDRIVEVELGDADGDGAQELLVLEEERDGLGRAATLWRWHGWGFSLDWRSAYGDYENMRLEGGEIFVDKLGG
jgi:poly-gamma-glutamate synthesis protein (capsule biosynthesis protein)